ncbi:hypothetical protein GCM10022255_038410 [Dactylosporangium darangshiense]|uniref:Acyl-CoA dehydrogenase n=2 Tax=Dactylosporangium darangshiense TaxID=579108 RepID=A0ABP8D927_9ACTN
MGRDFRAEVRAWLAEHLTGDFAPLVGTGGPGREHEHLDLRARWERELGAAGWIGLGWPEPYGRGASIAEQVVFFEEYARAGGPGRLSHIGEYLLAPTLIAHGTEEQQARFLPPIARGEELWCQGYSEPEAGSDLAGVRTRAELTDGEWRVTGQKVWTSLAHIADWCFVLARTGPGERKADLSYLLVPMRQDGVRVRPIVQLTGTSEFNEVFFDAAVTDEANVVGSPGDGWRVATSTLAFERGVATLGQQVGFARELDAVVARAALCDPLVADRVVAAWAGLQGLRHHALRTLSATEPDPTAASVAKLLWATWHQSLGELALAVDGPSATVLRGAPYELTDAQHLFLFTRADTIYGGSNEIQRNIIASRRMGASTVDFAGEFTPEQAALRDSVRAFLASPGYSWERLTGELGLTALPIAEEHGGFGATFVEAGIALEEAGAALLAAPLLSTTAAALSLDPALPAAAALLPSLAEGTTIAALALGGGVTFDERTGVLDGRVEHVLDGDAAGVFIVEAAGSLYATDAAVAHPVPTLDSTRGQATVVFTAAPARLVAPAGAQHALDVLHAALAAESVGVARAALRIAVEHLQTRHQFGVPLSTFQALRHRVADLYVLLEQATSTARHALRVAGTEEFALAAPLAKLSATEAAFTLTREAIQLLGGIGFTWEHSAHRYLKRAAANHLLAGDPASLRRLLLARAFA